MFRVGIARAGCPTGGRGRVPLRSHGPVEIPESVGRSCTAHLAVGPWGRPCQLLSHGAVSARHFAAVLCLRLPLAGGALCGLLSF